MEFFAHSGMNIDKSDWQKLAEHSENVTRLAAQMASVFGCENAAYAAGLFHDLGKYNPAFQRDLVTPHTGAWIETSNDSSPAAACSVAPHHPHKTASATTTAQHHHA